MCTSCTASLALIPKRLSVAVCRRIPGLSGICCLWFCPMRQGLHRFSTRGQVPSRPSCVSFCQEIQPPSRGCPTKVVRSVVDACKSCCVHFCTFSRCWSRVAPATAPIFGGNMSIESRERGGTEGTSRLQWSRSNRPLSKRGIVSMISRFFTPPPPNMRSMTRQIFTCGQFTRMLPEKVLC